MSVVPRSRIPLRRPSPTRRLSHQKRRTEEAIRRGEFLPYLQCIVDAHSQRIVGAEVLSRWQHPRHGLLSPGAYLPLLYAAGTIHQLDCAMFCHACRLLQRWQGTDLAGLRLSCNFDRGLISRPDFPETLQALSEQFWFDHSRLTLEITEDFAAGDQVLAADNLARCRQLGFSIALDDLGSGHAALPNLVDFPVDIVKLDKHVLDDAACPKGRTLLLGVIQLARQLGLSVLCEGVETRQQRELVTAGGCDYIQGFLYAAPLPLDQAEIYFRAYSAGLAFS